jgi:hypothetical protein
MNEQQRWRMGTGLLVGVPVLGMLILAVALATKSLAVLLIALALPPVFAVVVITSGIRGRRRDPLLVPPELQRLDPQERRLVSAAVSEGGRIADPDLAKAVVAHARRQQTVTGLFLAGGAIGVILRISSLVSGGDGGWAVVDAVVIAGWLVLAAIMATTLVRARRAIAANRPDVG